MPLVMEDGTTGSTAAPAGAPTSTSAGASQPAPAASVASEREPASADAEPEDSIEEGEAPPVDQEAEDAAAEAAKPPDWGDPEKFGWDDWDGAFDKLPEPLRPWAPKLTSWAEKKASARMQELESLRSAYEAILDGHEDPRLAELQTKLDGEAKTRAQLEAEYRQLQAQVQAIEKWAEEQETKRFEADLNKWRTENDWLFKEQRYLEAAERLLDQGWPYTALPELVKLPESILKSATEVYERTKDPEVALRLAKAEAGIGKPKKPSTADFVAGTDSPTVSARSTEANPRSFTNPREAAEHAARKHLRAVRR